MSSWKKFFKARTHQERPQPQSREKLGILEKPKDYLVRRKNFRRKQDMLLNLMKKAALKNPDEFYNKMISDKNVLQFNDVRNLIQKIQNRNY